MSEPTNLVLASGNRGKLAELQQMLSPLGLSVHPQQAFAVPEADETGLSFVENAILKARNAAQHSGHLALADDSGLEVDCLNGKPGIYSARFAGPDASDKDNVSKLLSLLETEPDANRSARFRCVLVLMRHAEDPTPLICQGTWEGRIALAPSGDNGFGYDPVFWVPDHQCCAAELSPEQKNALSHRGQALRQLLTTLPAFIGL